MTRSSDEGRVKRPERRGHVASASPQVQPREREESGGRGKAVQYFQARGLKAWLRVKANQALQVSTGSRSPSSKRGSNRDLYKIWNRMSSGTYFPPAVRRVRIPKSDGRERALEHPNGGRSSRADGVEAVSRAAGGTLVPSRLVRLSTTEIRGRSCWDHPKALLAVQLGRGSRHQRVLRQHRSLPLMMRAVRKHTADPWILLYVELVGSRRRSNSKTAPLSLATRGLRRVGSRRLYWRTSFCTTCSTCAGWLRAIRNVRSRGMPDDVVVHCRTEAEASVLRAGD